jgi:hypothetical protein
MLSRCMGCWITDDLVKCKQVGCSNLLCPDHVKNHGGREIRGQRFVVKIRGQDSWSDGSEIRGQTGRVLYGNEKPYVAVLFDLCPSAKMR